MSSGPYVPGSAPFSGANRITETGMTETDTDAIRTSMNDRTASRVIEAALGHVAFDGWSKATLEMAIARMPGVEHDDDAIGSPSHGGGLDHRRSDSIG